MRKPPPVGEGLKWSVAPSIPVNSYLLGYIAVGANVTSIVTANITTEATVAGLIGGYTVGAFTPTGIYTKGSPTPQVVLSAGRAYLEGVIGSSNANFVQATLYTLGSIPASFAPPSLRVFAVSANEIVLGALMVNTSGTLQWYSNQAFTNSLTMNIDGPSWRIY